MIEWNLGICSRVVYLELEAYWFTIFWETSILLYKVAVQIYIYTSNEWVFPLPHIISRISFQEFFILDILTGVRLNFRFGLTWIFIMSNDVKQFFKWLPIIWESSHEHSLFKSVSQFSNVLFSILISIFLNF